METEFDTSPTSPSRAGKVGGISRTIASLSESVSRGRRELSAAAGRWSHVQRNNEGVQQVPGWITKVAVVE